MLKNENNMATTEALAQRPVYPKKKASGVFWDKIRQPFLRINEPVPDNPTTSPKKPKKSFLYSLI